jgi:hypothetical protein
MIEALLAWFVATFLLAPVQSGLTAALEAGRAPAAVVEQVTRCAADATPRLVDRALGDPWWAFSTAIGASIGTTSPESVLRDAAPGCAAALAAARPFIERG